MTTHRSTAMGFTVAALVLTTAGCTASAGVDPGPPLTAGVFGQGEGDMIRVEERPSSLVMVVPRGKTRTWAAVIRAWNRLELPIARVDSAAGVVVNPRIRTSRKLAGRRLGVSFDCGRTAFGRDAANEYVLLVSIQTDVNVVSADTTRVVATVDATARDPRGTSNDAVPCGSRGYLEGAVLRATYDALFERQPDTPD